MFRKNRSDPDLELVLKLKREVASGPPSNEAAFSELVNAIVSRGAQIVETLVRHTGSRYEGYMYARRHILPHIRLEALPILLKLLCDDDSEVRTTAARSLLESGIQKTPHCTEVLEALLIALIDEEDIECFETMASLLGAIADDRVPFALHEMYFRLPTPYRDIAGDIYVQRMRWKYPAFIKPRRIGEQSDPFEKESHFQVHMRAVKAAEKVDVPALIRMLTSESDLNKVYATYEIRSQKLVDSRLVEPLLGCLWLPSAMHAAIAALAPYRDKRMIDAAIWFLRYSTLSGYGSTYGTGEHKCLAMVGKPAIGPIISAIRTSEREIHRLDKVDTRWRASITSSRTPAISVLANGVHLLESTLTEISDPAAYEDLKRISTQDPSPTVRKAAAEALHSILRAAPTQGGPPTHSA